MFIWKILAEFQTSTCILALHFSNSASCKVLACHQGLLGKETGRAIQEGSREPELLVKSDSGVESTGHFIGLVRTNRVHVICPAFLAALNSASLSI